ncbi:MAG: HAD family hydrolase [Ilumatobacteraceae bacterium]|nr:HAD family hydrolase [Ilumatobacteraceae bacterium]
MTRFDAVLFDAGGVLVLPDPTVLGPLLSPYGGSVDLELHRRAHYAGMREKANQDSLEGDWNAYNVAYVEAVGVDADLVDHAAVVLDHTRTHYLWRWPIPETLSALTALAGADVPMGVVSNASGQIEDALLRGGICQTGPGLGATMRVVVDSHVVGVAKPDPRIFEYALHAFSEFDRSRIAYVGDSVTMDVRSSEAAGLHPVLIDPFDDHAGAAFERVASVEAIVDWF